MSSFSVKKAKKKHLGVLDAQSHKNMKLEATNGFSGVCSQPLSTICRPFYVYVDAETDIIKLG